MRKTLDVIHFSFASSSQGELKTADLKGFVGVDRFDTAVLLSEEVAPEVQRGSNHC